MGRWLQILILGVVGVGLGYAAAQATRAPDRVEASAPPSPDALFEQLTTALRKKDAFERDMAMADALAAMDATNVDGAARAVDALVVPLSDCEVASYLNARAAFDPRGAFDQAASWASGLRRGNGLAVVARAWAQQGKPLEALEAAKSLEAVGDSKSALGAALNGWASSGEVDEVTQYLASLPAGEGRSWFVGFVTAHLAQQESLEALVAWGEAVTGSAAEDFSSEVYRNTLGQLANADPELALEWYEAHRGRDFHGGSLSMLVSGWQRVDGPKALDWLIAQEDNPDRDGALVAALQAWMHRDRPSAVRWVVANDVPNMVKARVPGLRRFVQLPRGGAQ